MPYAAHQSSEPLQLDHTPAQTAIASSAPAFPASPGVIPRWLKWSIIIIAIAQVGLWLRAK